MHCQKPPVYTAESCSNESVFLFFSTKSEQTVIQQSHIINPLLTSFALSVRESIPFGFYRTDLAPSSLGLYENLRQYFPVQTSHSVNKSLILCNGSCTKSLFVQKRLYLYPNLYTVVLILVIHYMNKTTSLLQYTTITPRLPAGSRSYLQCTTVYYNTSRLPAEVIYSILHYTTIHHGYQPKLSTVYYSILTIHHGYRQLKLSTVYYSILQYTTATSGSYLQYTTVYYNTPRLPAVL